MNAIDLFPTVFGKKVQKKIDTDTLIAVGVRLEYENQKIGWNDGIDCAAWHIKDEKIKQEILKLKK